jgi:hypothetical protein
MILRTDGEHFAAGNLRNCAWLDPWAGVDPKWDKKKKEPPSPAAQKLNREASNRVDRSHSMSRSWTMSVMMEKA